MDSDQDRFIEDEDQLESDEDLGSSSSPHFSNAVVSGNDWTTETLLNQINKGNIQLNPDFQRRDAWDRTRKSKFIESLVLGLPIPQVVLAESKLRRGSYIVLDGKQRLLSLRQFASSTEDPLYDQLLLAKLEIRKDLVGKSLEQLKNDPAHLDDLAAFENQPIRTVVIKSWPDESFLYHVFLRLNTGSVPLSPQELRQALHPGPFVKFLDEKSSESSALREILKLKKPDFRMRDAELLLRYYGFKNYLSLYRGTLKRFLDDTCENLNKQWIEQQPVLEEQLEQFEQAHVRIREVFQKNAYRKWAGSQYESRFNRAVFDFLILSFSIENVRDASRGREEEIEKMYRELMASDSEFLMSVESTTKSLTATHTRIAVWFESLNQLLGTGLHVPVLEANQIR